MLSRVELEYIQNPAAFSSDYGRVLRLRIRRKLNKLRGILQMLAESEFAPYIQEALKDVIRNCYCVTENCNGVTEFCNGKMSLKQADFNKLMVRPPGFEPGSSAWQADVLDQARLRPPYFLNCYSYDHALKFFSLVYMHI